MDTPKHTTKEALTVGNKLGLTWQKVKPRTLRQGMDVEEEHNENEPVDTVNPNVVHGDKSKLAKIAIAHIGEIPNYYDKLKIMEGKEGKKEIIKKHLKKNSK